MKSKKDYISTLNDLGNSLSREEWIIGGKDRYVIGRAVLFVRGVF